MQEIERIYLAKSLPNGLQQCKKKDVHDTYYPLTAAHPVVRLRKANDKYEITKKVVLHESDKTVKKEENISLTKEEYDALAVAKGKVVHKIRYFYPYQGKVLEIGVFQGALKGLVTVDVEFSSKAECASFEMPDFCLADISQAGFLAGGLICGKTYADLEPELRKYRYKRLI